MHTATLQATLFRASDTLHRASSYLQLPAWVVRAYVVGFSGLATRRLYRMADRLSRGVLDAAELTRMINDADDKSRETIDPNRQIAGGFDQQMGELKAVHRDFLSVAQTCERWQHTTKVSEAARQCAAICAELYEALSALAWAVAENDASCAPRQPGCVASTPDEVFAMLDRIAAGE